MAEDLDLPVSRKRPHDEVDKDGQAQGNQSDTGSESDDDIGPALPSAEAPK